MGAHLLSPGLSPLIRVPARSFPMAEHKTGSLLLGTNPLHPGLSNGLEGAVRLAVNPPQLERSPSVSSPIHTRTSFSPGVGDSFGLFSDYALTFFFFFFFPPRVTSPSFSSLLLFPLLTRALQTTSGFCFDFFFFFFVHSCFAAFKKFISLAAVIGCRVWHGSIDGGV